MELDISTLGTVPFTYNELASWLTHYSAPKNKAQELEKKGLIVRLKKGLYVLSPKVSRTSLVPELVANHIHGPSYVSQHTALRHYGLIPEHVFTIKSMTPARSTEYTNSIGRFVYTHTSKEYYSIGITLQSQDGIWYQIATPEKALCDVIVSTAGLNLRSTSALLRFLEEDLRFDMDVLHELNADIISACAITGKKQDTLFNLKKMITR